MSKCPKKCRRFQEKQKPENSLIVLRQQQDCLARKAPGKIKLSQILIRHRAFAGGGDKFRIFRKHSLGQSLLNSCLQ